MEFRNREMVCRVLRLPAIYALMLAFPCTVVCCLLVSLRQGLSTGFSCFCPDANHDAEVTRAVNLDALGAEVERAGNK